MIKKYHVSKNLWDGTVYNRGINGSTGEIMSASNRYAIYIPVKDNTSYTISRTIGASTYFYYGFTDTLPAAGVICSPYGDMSQSATTYTVANTNHKYLVFFFGGGMSTNIMVNEGSTPQPYGNTWTEIPYYLHNTSTDTITTLPAVLYPNAATATVGLKGNMSQTGTPTPQNPVMPNGCGERTGNLFDMSFYEGKSGITVSGNKATGTCDRFFNVKLSIPPELYGQELTWSAYFKRPDNPNTVRLQTVDNGSYKYGNNITGEGRSTVSFTATSTIRLYVNYANTGSDTIELSDITLNLGSEALPYEPYGVKIPILSAGQTTPVYLGEVQSTRKIKKLVLTGDESWTKSTTYSGSFYARIINNEGAGGTANIYPAICSHATKVNRIDAQTYVYGKFAFDGGTNPYNLNLFIGEASWSKDDFKAYLAQQYAAGTPVTVWYVLAEPTTGIVNEPIRKIGDYADELSNISIPVTAGGDTISVGTTLQPSEITVNYKGWHPKTPKESNNGSWT